MVACFALVLAACGVGLAPSGRVLAMNITSGVESDVVFAPGEAVQLDFGTYAFRPGRVLAEFLTPKRLEPFLY